MRAVAHSMLASDAASRSTLVLTSARLTHADKLSLLPMEELKLHLRLLDDSENPLLARLIDAAYDFLVGAWPQIGQGYLNGCVLLQQTFEYVCPLTCVNVLSLPLRPILPNAVISFEALQPDGTYQAIEEETYRFFSGWPDASFVRLPFKRWTPFFAASFEHSARIVFRAGFGSTASDVPADLKLALRMLVGHWYRNREAVGAAEGEVGFGLRNLCRPYRTAVDHS